MGGVKITNNGKIDQLYAEFVHIYDFLCDSELLKVATLLNSRKCKGSFTVAWNIRYGFIFVIAKRFQNCTCDNSLFVSWDL